MHNPASVSIPLLPVVPNRSTFDNDRDQFGCNLVHPASAWLNRIDQRPRELPAITHGQAAKLTDLHYCGVIIIVFINNYRVVKEPKPAGFGLLRSPPDPKENLSTQPATVTRKGRSLS